MVSGPSLRVGEVRNCVDFSANPGFSNLGFWVQMFGNFSLAFEILNTFANRGDGLKYIYNNNKMPKKRKYLCFGCAFVQQVDSVRCCFSFLR